MSKVADFNPRSHEGSDKKSRKGRSVYQISIHAPTKGATGDAGKTVYSNGISIHAPTKGATAPPQLSNGAFDISIHAPTKGATH